MNNEKSTTLIIQISMPDISAKKEEVQIAYESLKKMIDKLKVRGKIDHIVIVDDFGVGIGEERMEEVYVNLGSNSMKRTDRSLTEFSMSKDIKS